VWMKLCNAQQFLHVSHVRFNPSKTVWMKFQPLPRTGGRFGFIVLLNAFTTYGAPSPVDCKKN